MLDRIISVNQSDIADYEKLEATMEGIEEDLIGSEIILNKRKFMTMRDRAYDMERFYRLRALSSWILPSMAAYYFALSRMYKEIGDYCDGKYQEYLKKEELYDRTEADTAGLFSLSSTERSNISGLLVGLLGSFTIEDYMEARYDSTYINYLRKNINLPIKEDLETYISKNTISYERMYDALSDTNREFVDRIETFDDVRITDEKRETLKFASIQFLYEGFEATFVIGMLANIVYEADVGIAERSSYIRYPNLKPSYLVVMDNHFQYSKHYSGKRIQDIGIKQIQTLEEKCRDFNLNSENYDIYPVKSENEFSNYSKKREAKYGLGMFQHTDSIRRGHLIECYVEFVDSQYPKEEQYAYAEIEMTCRELTGFYGDDDLSNIYNDWKILMLNSEEKSVEATKTICRRYENPIDYDSTVKDRIEMAQDLYQHVAKTTSEVKIK